MQAFPRFVSNVKIIYDMGKLILISDHRDNQETQLYTPDDTNDEKDLGLYIIYNYYIL